MIYWQTNDIIMVLVVLHIRGCKGYLANRSQYVEHDNCYNCNLWCSTRLCFRTEVVFLYINVM